MEGDCHVHMALDGADYREALARHRTGPDQPYIRRQLASYRDAGITFLRDGGDRFGAAALASQLGPEYGIDYRQPGFPIHKVGHYGGFIGRAYETLAQYRALVAQVRREGGDFVKLMLSGLMDFDHAGVLTGQSLEAGEIRDLIACAHDAGLAVMAHVNGAAAVRNALLAGADSVEHGAYQDDDCLRLLAETGAVWVPTVATVGNLRGGGRYAAQAVADILSGQLRSIRTAAAYGACIAAGSDAGAYRVPHGRGLGDESALLAQALGPGATELLRRGQARIQQCFRPGG